MKTFYHLFILLIIILLVGIKSQAQFRIGGEFRTRAWVNYGYGNLPKGNDAPATYIEQRIRVNFFYEKSKIQFYFSGQDDRVWGQEQYQGSYSLGVNEAWINFLLTDDFNIKIGRQLIGYDNGRLISDADWNNWGNSFDIGLLQYHNKEISFSIDWGFGINNKSGSNFKIPYDVNFYKYISYLWINKKFLDDKINLSWMNILNGAEKPDDIEYIITDTLLTSSGEDYYIKEKKVTSYPGIIYVNYTSGIFLNINFLKNLYYEGEFYYQGGKTINGKDLEALMYSSWLSFQNKKFELGIGYQYASGSDLSDSLEYTERSTTYRYNMYGNEGDPFYGEMSYFIYPSRANYAGITDFVGYIKYQFSRKINASVYTHYLGLAKKYISPDTRVDKHLGLEFDFKIEYTANKNLSFELNYGIMLPENSLKKLQGIPVNEKEFANYGMIKINYTPTFFVKNIN